MNLQISVDRLPGFLTHRVGKGPVDGNERGCLYCRLPGINGGQLDLLPYGLGVVSLTNSGQGENKVEHCKNVLKQLEKKL